MIIEVTTDDGVTKSSLATYTIKGIDQIAHGDLAQKENVTQPKVTLSFELTRSGLLQLNKAEVKLEETYLVEERPSPIKKPKKPVVTEEAKAETNETDSSDDTSSTTNSE